MTTVLDINLIAGRRRQKQRAITILRCAVYSLIVLFLAVALLYAVADRGHQADPGSHRGGGGEAE